MAGFRESASLAAAIAGGVSLVLIAGALISQYVGGLPPCPMCHWQRWPHIAGAIVGLGGAFLVRQGVLAVPAARAAAYLAISGLMISGAIGVFHAGVEWDFWDGPAWCGASSYVPGQDDEAFNIVRCDVAAWRDPFLGLSLAGYNALISFVVAGYCLSLLGRKGSS
jgi:disulfide bond formation protein DsbB